MRIFRKIIIVIPPLLLLINLSPVDGQKDEEFTPYQRAIMICVDPEVRDNFYVWYGEICSWQPGEDELLYETEGVYASSLALSPDGTKVVYMTLPDTFVEPYLAGNDPTQGIGPYPTDIGLMDLTVQPGNPDRFISVADQETGMSADINENSVHITFQRRSAPVWSPDSTKIAWAELDFLSDGFGGRIAVYDTTTDTIEIIANHLSLGYADAGMWGVPAIDGWGDFIIYTSHNAGVYTETADSGGFGTVMEVIDLTGRLASMPVSYFTDYEDQLFAIQWLQDGEEWRLGLHYASVGWVMLEPLTDSWQRLQNPPVVRAVTDTDWTYQVTNSGELIWWVGENIVNEDVPRIPLTFTPAGSPVWINGDWTPVYFSREALEPLLPFNNDSMPIADIVWTTVIWTTDGEGVPLEPQVVP